MGLELSLLAFKSVLVVAVWVLGFHYYLLVPVSLIYLLWWLCLLPLVSLLYFLLVVPPAQVLSSA